MASLPLGRILDIIPLVEPIDLDNSQSGDQFSLRDAGGALLVFITGVGSAGRDLTFTVKKHADMADGTGTTIDLTGIAHPYHYKKQGTAATVVGDGSWAKVANADTDGAGVVLDDADGETSTLFALYIDRADLGDGYTSLSVSAVVAGGSGAKLGAAMAILTDLAVQRTPANLRSALA